VGRGDVLKQGVQQLGGRQQEVAEGATGPSQRRGTAAGCWGGSGEAVGHGQRRGRQQEPGPQP
jgi:hypothetical protein